MKVKRVLYLTHRWFGILMCLVFFLWFASGIVMMYVEYPQLTREERVQSLSPLPVDEIQVDLPEELTNSDGRITEVSIYSHLDRPVYLIQFNDQTSSAYFADTGDSVPQTTEISAEQAARIFAGNAGLGEGASYVKALDMDQWTVYGGFSSHRPLHQVALDNPRGTVLYISDSTGQVVRDTHAWERAWNWVGSTIHWIYPMQLRKQPDTWANVVIVISMLGVIAVVTGTIVGFLRLRTARRYKNGSVTPYHGMQKWHHLLGLAFTLFVTTFVVSGLFSMNPFGVFDDESSPAPQISRYEGGALRLEGLRSALDSIPEEMADIKELSWHQINGAGVLVAHSNAGRRAINLSYEELEARILESVPLLVPTHPEFQLDELDEFDHYYYSTHNRYRPLPAYRVRFSDEERTWYYIDAETGEILFRSTAINRIERWLYNGLHSLDFQFLFANRPLWDIVVIVLSLAGIVFSYTAVVIGWRRLKRTKVRFGTPRPEQPLNTRHLLALALVLITQPAFGHHAPALYDNERLMRLDGRVVELSFRFPHSTLLVDSDDGERWTVSLAPPDVSERQGKKEALLAIEAGEPITVYGWPHRIREFEIRSHKLELGDGAVIEGAVNTLFEPRVQKELKRLLRNSQALGEFESLNPSRELANWIDADKPLRRLALEISRSRASFIGVENEFPGVKPHLTCLPTRFPAEKHDIDELPDSADSYIRKHNEWLARYLEGQLNICEAAE